MNDKNQIEKTYVSKEEIEQLIIQNNYKHFTQAHDTEIYNDQIYEKLQEDNTRNKIISGRLRREECDHLKVFKFLKLLKRNSPIESARSVEYIKVKDWFRQVKKAKKNSISSIHSKRTYAVYKCALGCTRMTAILVAVMNLFIREMYYPKRWLNLTEVSLEKGKGPVLGKLRFITLIEGDL